MTIMNRKTVFFTLILMSFISISFGQRTLAPLPKSKNGFIVIAHRGSHLVKPENSIAAIEEAIELGADYVEIDLRTTRDGHLVLLHNETLDGTTNGKGRVQNLNLDEVQKLSLNAKDGKLYAVPSFMEALKTCRNRINIYLDFKAADVLKTYQEIRAAGMENQVLVYINKMEDYKSWRELAPQMPLMSGLPKNIKTKDELISFLKEMPLEATDNIPNAALVAAMRENGLSVFLDVQMANENPIKWKIAMEKGVQGVQTDHPATLIQYLKTNQLRNGLKVSER
ncbi:glycerophosphodiester phosphodiesterase family protein [Pedobacter gandavensis]|uniref:glycerophosphodiester phosphodiesterase family protein n=1 Tax=Pedobacter gandavensis TaxID=2679963 RepID=UPI00247B095D|nr:glycerophosphodiester phosphodiesterase family protein [Pedobacter gandavensis]WGQ10532.1 glycerophosphodiester phosphodiesterase family protein [Pedobacter gandavensis]